MNENNHKLLSSLEHLEVRGRPRTAHFLHFLEVHLLLGLTLSGIFPKKFLKILKIQGCSLRGKNDKYQLGLLSPDALESQKQIP